MTAHAAGPSQRPAGCAAGSAAVRPGGLSVTLSGCSSVKSQKAVAAYFSRKQLLPIGFALCYLWQALVDRGDDVCRFDTGVSVTAATRHPGRGTSVSPAGHKPPRPARALPPWDATCSISGQSFT